MPNAPCPILYIPFHLKTYVILRRIESDRFFCKLAVLAANPLFLDRAYIYLPSMRRGIPCRRHLISYIESAKICSASGMFILSFAMVTLSLLHIQQWQYRFKKHSNEQKNKARNDKAHQNAIKFAQSLFDKIKEITELI